MKAQNSAPINGIIFYHNTITYFTIIQTINKKLKLFIIIVIDYKISYFNTLLPLLSYTTNILYTVISND